MSQAQEGIAESYWRAGNAVRKMSEAKQTSASGNVSIKLTTSGLPEKAVSKLNRALQQALLTQLAELAPARAARIELGSPEESSLQLEFPGGRTDGIVAQFESL